MRGNIVDVRIASDLVELKFKDGPNSWVKLSNLGRIYLPGLISLPLELAVALAQVQAEVEPTLLVIDEIGLVHPDHAACLPISRGQRSYLPNCDGHSA